MITIRKYGDVERYITIKKFLKRSLFNANVYRFGNTMFDTGINMGTDILPLSRGVENIFISHRHHDHVGNNAVVQDQNSCTIYCHANAVRGLEDPDNSSFIECFIAGRVAPSKPTIFPDSVESDGFEVRQIYTPGHSDDHVGYYLPEKRYLFSGDLVLWGKTRWVSDEVNIYDAMGSLERISKLDIEILFPSHGRPFEEPDKVIEEKISHLTSMGDSVLELDGRGFSRKEIRDRILGKEETLAFITRGRFSKLNLVDSFLDHRY
ncbi:MAG TPA: MBL fold metallo-hydrolase [Candidatus Methanofastidiosa archaeon]|nr:MBL fold metallo-hydrolase [Candidatus Methanofastidiosa archaeon]HPR41310.1 MBL fold metallo-hydrolase [Candidatus Methanofastidiosa archaeon]